MRQIAFSLLRASIDKSIFHIRLNCRGRLSIERFSLQCVKILATDKELFTWKTSHLWQSEGSSHELIIYMCKEICDWRSRVYEVVPPLCRNDGWICRKITNALKQSYNAIPQNNNKTKLYTNHDSVNKNYSIIQLSN